MLLGKLVLLCRCAENINYSTVTILAALAAAAVVVIIANFAYGK
jgi:hypothetical protein